jgi:hypothetical protein
MEFPTLSETQISSLLSIGKDLYVGDYNGPKQDKIIGHARSVCNIFDWPNIQNYASRFEIQKTDLLQDPNTFNPAHINWFSLGVVFQYANSYFAGFNRPLVPFLRYALMCFNGGWGWKQWEYRPDRNDWDLCQLGDDSESCAACVRVGEDILKKALQKRERDEPELTINERMNLATRSYVSIGL